jgi:hypothetical protein
MGHDDGWAIAKSLSGFVSLTASYFFAKAFVEYSDDQLLGRC